MFSILTNRFIASDACSSASIGLWLALGAATLFSLKGIWIKLAYGLGVEPVQIMTLRMGFSLPLYAGLAIWWSVQGKFTGKPIGKYLPRAVVVGVMGYYLASFLDLSGLVYISAQLERVVLFSYPAFTVLLARIVLGERLPRAFYWVLPLSWLGILLMAFGQQDSAPQAHQHLLLGVGLVTCSALSFAAYLLLSKPIIAAIGSQLFTCVAMLSASAGIFIHYSFTHSWTELLTLPPAAFIYGACIALFSTVLPSFMFSAALIRLGPSKTAMTGNISPVATLVLAAVILGESLGWLQLLGAALVIVAISALTRRKG